MELSERPNFSLDHPELLEKTIGLVVSPTKFVVSPTKTRRIADIGPNQWINSLLSTGPSSPYRRHPFY